VPRPRTGSDLSGGRLLAWAGRSGDGGGLSRRHGAGVELVFAEEQTAPARAAVLDLDLPRGGGGPRAAHLQNTIVWVPAVRRVKAYARPSSMN